MTNKASEMFKRGNDFYDVEKIITKKCKGNKRYYLIKWVGYPLTECSWEPASNLETISKMLEDFDNNYPNSIDKRQLKMYLRLNKRNRNKKNINRNKVGLKNNSQNQDNSTKNHLIIRIDFSGNFIEEEKEEFKNNMNIVIPCTNNNDKNDEELKEIEIFSKNIDENKNEEEINIRNGNNLTKIENEPTDENDVPKLIKPIIIW